MKRIFLSSVQKEFAKERKLLKKYIEGNPILRRFFSVFVFELDVAAKDRTTKQVFLAELKRSDIYLCLVGDQYGFEDKDGISPTEREYDAATKSRLQRLVSSYPVNPLIAEPLYQTGHIERLGTGLEDLFKTCRAEGLPRSRIEVSGSEMHVTIFRNGGVASVPNKVPNKVPDKIRLNGPAKFAETLTLIGKHPYETAEKLAIRLKVSCRTVRKQIKYLKDEGLIIRIGSKKDGHWEVMGAALNPNTSSFRD